MSIDELNDATPDEAVTHPAASPEEAALLAWAAEHPTPRPTPERNGQGRYKLPDPTTGKAATWTRATGFASTLDDGAGLTTWRNRLLVAGLATSPDLVRSAALAAEAKDSKALSSCASTALHVAGEKLAADIGTALHTATEHHDLGTGERPPAPWDRHVDAWAELLERHGIECLPQMVERIGITAELGCAGTLDRIASIGTDRLVLDLKTGKSCDRSSYAIQLAIYAHASHLWAIDGSGYEAMPPVSQETALIVHLPAAGGPASLIEVDIAAGWEMAQLCGLVRAARKRKGMFVPRSEPKAPAPPLPATRTEWIAQRITMLAGSTAAVKLVRERWAAELADVAPKPTDGWTDTEVDRIDAVLAGVETLVEAPFPHLDPSKPTPVEVSYEATLVANAKAAAAAESCASAPSWPEPDEGEEAAQSDMAGLLDTVNALPDQRRQHASGWAHQAKLQQRPWAAGSPKSERCVAINAAALACVTHLWDDDVPDELTRAALAVTIDDDLQPSWLTGAVLGSLTIAQAHRLAEIATSFGASDPPTCEAVGLAATRAA